MKTEKRFQNQRIIRAKTTDDGKKYFEGYAAVFNQKSKLLREYGDPFYEIIRDGAFDEVLKSDDLSVKLNVNHDNEKLLARTESETLILTVDDVGLKYRSSVPNTTAGNDAFELIKRGDYFESSFAFGLREGDQTWSYNESENAWLREITNIPRLMDVSIVTDGAYANTDVTVAQRHLKEFEDKNLHKAERRKIEVELKLLELS